MRKYYLDNIKWITVVIVVLYHVIYMYNAEGIQGVCGKITDLEVQYFDVFQYIVYPWFMMLLFMVSGVTSRLYLDNHTHREFISSRTTKLLVPSTESTDLYCKRNRSALVHSAAVAVFYAACAGAENRQRQALECLRKSKASGTRRTRSPNLWRCTDLKYADCLRLSLRAVFLCFFAGLFRAVPR